MNPHGLIYLEGSKLFKSHLEKFHLAWKEVINLDEQMIFLISFRYRLQCC